uniref:ABC transporter C family member 13 n=1 Tax=Rhizophora mucronata TaxID=61149 RepID=A0A2P2M4I8_RHIMU
MVADPSSVSVKVAYIGERETLSSLRNSLDVVL